MEKMSDFDRISKYLSRDNESGCLIFCGSLKPSGHGQISFRGGIWLAHRAWWVLSGRDLPTNKGCLVQVCGNKTCVEPEHMKIVSHKMAHTSDPLARIRAKSNLSANGCIECDGPECGEGYVAFYFSGRQEYAHRAAWIMSNGDIPVGMNVCHRCDNRRCINVDHLFLGSQKDNLIDMAIKSRGAKSSFGLPYGVHVHKNKNSFSARVHFDSRQIYLGSYRTIEAAAAVAKSTKDLLYGLRPDDSDYEGAEWGDYGSCVHGRREVDAL